MRHARFLVFVIALAVLVFLPNAESRILQIVKSAGLVLTLFRGLLGYYDDYVKMLEERGKPKTM
jgi:UDP-N-acetylmuramyl pentapeptide phosphotransferase/UDP-N-acetylglucosamine-1-phosphate transferase